MNDIFTLVGNSVDILTIAETKLDRTFPEIQFCLPTFKTPYRLDISDRSGGMLTFVKNDIPSHRLCDFILPPDNQLIPIELNLRKRKWLLISIYRNPKQNISYFLEHLTECIMFYSKYDYIIINGDFNLEPESPELSTFITSHSFYNHMKEKTCWKSENGSCIDLIISNKKLSLMNTGTCETGLSDYHLLIYTMLRTTFDKRPPKKIKYRNFSKFDNSLFLSDLGQALDYNTNDYTVFNNVFSTILDKHAPLKTKFLRGNNQPHVTKELRKAIMKRSQLKTIANKTKSPTDMAGYKKQRNLVVKLNRQAKKRHFTNASKSTKCFWKAVNPYFSTKTICEDRILLVDDGKILSNDEDVAVTFNEYFNRVTDFLDIPVIPSLGNPNLDPVFSVIAKFTSHPSILAIRAITRTEAPFELQKVTEELMIKEILDLNPNKKVSGSESVKALQLAAYHCSHVLTNCFNKSIAQSIFPNELKCADIIPVHKKDSTTSKSNYRPISLLPAVSKVFERLIAKQILSFLETRFSKFLCGFRKGYNPQYSLLHMLRKWQSSSK